MTATLRGVHGRDAACADGQIKILTRLTNSSARPALVSEKTTFQRIRSVAASAFAYPLNVSRGLAISGDGIAWGSGEISIHRRIPFFRFVQSVGRGRPVVFLIGSAGHSYDRLIERVQLDDLADVYSNLNGNDCLVLQGRMKGQEVVAHVGVDKPGRSAISRHHDGLLLVRSILQNSPVSGMIAQPLSFRFVDDLAISVEALLSGQSLRLRSFSSQIFVKILSEALKPLSQICRATIGRAIGCTGVLSDIRRDIWQVRPHCVAELAVAMLRDVEMWMAKRTPATVLVHGDYTVDNLLFSAGFEVTGITDWEWCQRGGCAGFDALQLVLWAFSEYRRNSPRTDVKPRRRRQICGFPP